MHYYFKNFSKCKARNFKLVRYKGRCGFVLEGDKLTIVHFHGLGGNFYENPFIYNLIEAFNKENITFISINSSTHDKDDDFYEDVENFRELIESYERVILQGHSYGCIKVAYYIHKFKPSNVVGTILLAPPDMKWIFDRYIKLKEVDDSKYYEVYLDIPCVFKGSVIRRLFLEDNFPMLCVFSEEMISA